MNKIIRKLVVATSFFVSLSLSGQEKIDDHAKTTVDTLTQKSSIYHSLRKRFYKTDYDTLEINKKGFTVKPSITFGAGYRVRRQGEGKDPFAFEHSLIAYYAINRGAFYIEYKSVWNQLIGAWNLGLAARADLPNSVFFFGVGNETQKLDGKKNRYYQLRSTEFYGAVNLNRFINKIHFLEVRPFYQSIKVRNNDDKFITSSVSGISKSEFDQKHFVGAAATYIYHKVNNTLVPTKGAHFDASAAFSQNIKNKDSNFIRYTSSAAFYVPLSRTISLAIRAGGAVIQGNPEFYQLNRLGGNINLRGFRRERFWGRQSFYNNNEVRWLVPTNNRFFDGKIGLLLFADEGRVWQRGEDSRKWHVGFGGGPLIQVFNGLLINATYGFSDDDVLTHLRLGFLF